MKDWKELTQEEFNSLKQWKGQIAYTESEMMGLINLSRAFINPRTPTCLSCSSNMRDTKEKLMSWYLSHKEEWEQMFAAPEAIETITPKTNGKAKTK